MQSMTGYGKAEYAQNGITLSVEIKTVNNRFLDVTAKYPRSFVAFDDAIRKTVQSKIKRGRAEVFVTYVDRREETKTLFIDEALCSKYAQAAKYLSDKFGLENDFTVCSLMRSPDCLSEQVDDSASEEIGEILKSTLNLALDNLNEMRKIEGEKLKKDLLFRHANSMNIVSDISNRAPKIKEEYALKIKERMADILGGVGYDESRMLQEVALFADKSNIDEELARLKSHGAQLVKICEEEIDVGKKLDFLMQEFNREANTVCSKSNDIEITRLGLSLKNEIEKMREQVQNIE